MIYISHEHELRDGCQALSPDEVKWLRKLERLLCQCPSDRLGFLATGDQNLTVINHDMVQAEELEVHDQFASDNGIRLGSVSGVPFFIATTA